MKIIKARHTDHYVTCEHCGSILELETDGEVWDWNAEILDCPVCHKRKKRNV